MTKLYVYASEQLEGDEYVGQPVDIIEGDNNEDCEQLFEAKWGGNDYSATYIAPRD